MHWLLDIILWIHWNYYLEIDHRIYYLLGIIYYLLGMILKNIDMIEQSLYILENYVGKHWYYWTNLTYVGELLDLMIWILFIGWVTRISEVLANIQNLLPLVDWAFIHYSDTDLIYWYPICELEVLSLWDETLLPVIIRSLHLFCFILYTCFRLLPIALLILVLFINI